MRRSDEMIAMLARPDERENLRGVAPREDLVFPPGGSLRQASPGGCAGSRSDETRRSSGATVVEEECETACPTGGSREGEPSDGN